MKTFLVILLCSEGFWTGFYSGILSGIMVSLLIGITRWGLKKGIFIEILEPNRQTNSFKIYNSGFFDFTELSIKSQISFKGLLENQNTSIFQIPVDGNIPYVCNSLRSRKNFINSIKFHFQPKEERVPIEGSLFTLNVNQIRGLQPEIQNLNDIVNNYNNVILTIYIDYIGRFTGIRKRTKRTIPLRRIPV